MAAEDWKGILKGVDLSGLAGLERPGSGGWVSREDILNSPQSPERKYTFSKGIVNIDMAADPNYAALVWDGRLPDFLIPGDLDNLMELKNMALVGFPTIMYPKHQLATQYRQDYHEDSLVSIVFADGQQKNYRFAHERADKELAIDFVTRGSEISSLLITGKMLPLLQEFKYMFKADYLSQEEANMALIFPNREDCLVVWNPDTMAWILGTHREKDKLSADPFSEGAELSYLVSERASEVLDLKALPLGNSTHLDWE
jgi:hypothetical protein